MGTYYSILSTLCMFGNFHNEGFEKEFNIYPMFGDYGCLAAVPGKKKKKKGNHRIQDYKLFSIAHLL